MKAHIGISRGRRNIVCFLAAAVYGVLCASCATGPYNFKAALASAEGEFSLFPSGALYYGFIDKKADPRLYRAFFNEDQIGNASVRRILSKTQRASFALYRNVLNDAEGRGAGLYALLRGNYPVAAAAFTLDREPLWTKVKDAAGIWWRAKNEPVTLALRNNAVLLALGTIPFENTPAALPEGLGEFRRGAACALYLPSGDLITSYLAELDIPITIPIRRAFLAIRPHEWGYTAAARLDTPTSAQAKLAASMLTLMRRGLLPASSDTPPVLEALLANPPSVQGTSVFITSAPVSAEEAARLARFFSPLAQDAAD